MEVELRINGVIASLDVAANESLLSVLRKEGYFSVKHGCGTGDCGACTVLVDGMPRPACVTFAAQVGGCTLTTVEGLGSARGPHGLHPLQTAFADTGAVGCGFCTPGMLLSAYALLKRNTNPTEEDARDALSGHLCRCAGYLKPVQAVLKAAAIMRREVENAVTSSPEPQTSPPGEFTRKIDALKLVSGKAAFADDTELRGMLYGRLLTSPHSHAVIREIDVSEARALPGVHAVLTYHDIPRIPAPGANQTAPCDRYSLDYIARFAGDRVAAVAAETPEIAEQALRLIRVDYEVLPAILDPRKAVEPGAARIHPEAETTGIFDSSRNLVAHKLVETGSIERGFAGADLVVEGEYVVPQWQQAPIENHIVITLLDEDDRLVVRTSTEAPHAIRHALTKLLGLPARQIRVLQPALGGGAKHDLLLEDICALLTLATQRPVRLEYSRAEEFRSSYTTEARIIHLKTGIKRDGSIVANQVQALANAGAYAGYSSAALPGAGELAFSLYACPNSRSVTDVVYTHLPPAGISQGAGGAAGCFALESHTDEIARQLGMDALEYRRKNWLRSSDTRSLDPKRMAQCLRIIEERLSWKEKRARGGTGRYRRGVGAAITIHSTHGGGKSGAVIRLDEDGSFHVLVGAPDSGDGSHTILAQVAAEALGVRVEDILIELSDTDSAPFASASSPSLWYTCAPAIINAAGQVRERILEVAGRLLKAEPGTLTLQAGEITALNGDSVTIAQVAMHSLYAPHEEPILVAVVDVAGEAVEVSPTFAAVGTEVEVDTETGVVRVLRVVTAIDAGRVIHPALAEATVEGEITRALGRTLSEELCYDSRGVMLTNTLRDYHPFSAADMPPLETHFLESADNHTPYGAKPYAQCAGDAVAPAVANALADALGVRVRQIPLTPERVSRTLRAHSR